MGIIPTIDGSDLVVSEGLVGRWMGGVKGVPVLGTVRDLSSKGNDGTLVADAFVNGDGLQLDGTGDYVEFSTVSANTGISQNTKGSVTAWAKTSDSSYQTLFSMTSTTSNNRLVVFGFSSFSAYVQAYDNEEYNDLYKTTTTFTDGKWHHIAITSDATTWKIFVDGIDQPLVAVVGANNGKWFSSIGVTESTSPRIGYLNPTYTYYWNGTLSDTRIYNKALVQSEISQIYNTTKWRHQ